MTAGSIAERRTEALEPSRMWSHDLALEAFAGIFARPSRMVMTIVGTMIGLTALVATLGLSRTAGEQIISRFDALAATEITVTSRPAAEGQPTNDLPWDAVDRLRRLNGIAAVGTLSAVDVGDDLVTASTFSDPQRSSGSKLPIAAASPELFAVIHARVRAGRLPDEGHSQRADRVAILGPNAAERLGIDRVGHLPSIRIGEDVFLVIGILDSVERKHTLLSSVIIPEGTARELYGLRTPQSVVVETEVGAVSLLSKQIPVALRPDAPLGLKVSSPEQPQPLRGAVARDLQLLFLMLGGVSLLVGALGIANVTLVSVVERTGEIGLRRALGATRLHIGSQFILESATLGLVSGILGASVGMLVVVVVAALQGWTPVMDPSLPLLSPLVGALTGLIAGLYPAVRAARLEPVEALRAGT